jgi:hypothetical protein
MPKPPRIATLLTAAALAPFPGGPAAADRLSADRPTFSAGPSTVAPGRVQVEAGYRHNRFDDGDVETDILPEANVRQGLVPGLEANLAMDGYVERRTPGRDRSGVGDLAAGFKMGQWTTPFGRFGVLARAVLPTGDAPGTVDDPGVTAAALWARDLNPYAHLFGTLQAGVDDAFGDADTTWYPAFGIDTLLTGSLRGFLEYYAAIPEAGGTGHTVSTGLTLGMGPETQLDLHFGAGLSDEAPDSAGFGVAHRF